MNEEKDNNNIEPVNLKVAEKDALDDMLQATSSADFDNLVALFNLNQKKKNAVRIVKLNDFLDKIEDQAIERFTNKPAQMSNEELIKYLQVIQQAIDRSQNYVDRIEDRPMIQVNQQTTNINIKENETLNRASREKVLDIFKQILESAEVKEEDVIDVTPEENGEELND